MARQQAASRRFQFPKRSQLFIRSHNETLSFGMCIGNEAVRRGENPRCSADILSGASFD
jgi:hypothetical protein